MAVLCWRGGLYSTPAFCLAPPLCGSVAEWLAAPYLRSTGSNAGRRAADCNPRHVVYTHVPLSLSSIIWYRPMGGDARRGGEVTAGLTESSRQPTAGLMASVTCGLTAEDRDQLRNPRLVSSVTLPLFNVVIIT